MVIFINDYLKSRASRRISHLARPGGNLSCRFYHFTQRAPTSELPQDFSLIDIKSFLEDAGALATQI